MFINTSNGGFFVPVSSLHWWNKDRGCLFGISRYPVYRAFLYSSRRLILSPSPRNEELASRRKEKKESHTHTHTKSSKIETCSSAPSGFISLPVFPLASLLFPLSMSSYYYLLYESAFSLYPLIVTNRNHLCKPLVSIPTPLFSPLFIRCRFTVASSGHQVRNRGGFRESEKVNFLFLHSEVDAHFSGLFFRAPSKWIECLRDYRRSRSPPFLAVECPHPFGGLFFVVVVVIFPLRAATKRGRWAPGKKERKETSY